MSKNKEKMSILQSLGYAIHLIWKADKKVVFITFYKECTEQVFKAFFVVYLLKYIYKCIEEDIAFTNLVWVVALFCALHIVIHINSAYMTYQLQVKEPIVYRYVFHKVIKKAETIELVRYEQPEFFNKFSRALDECLSTMMEGMHLTAISIGRFLCFLTSLIIMGTLDYKLPIIAFLASIGTVIFSLIMNKYQMKRREAETQERRVMDYTKRVFYEKKYAGEIRLYPIKKVIFDKFQKNNDSRFRKHKKFYRIIAFYQVMESVVCADAAILGTYLYINYVLKVQGSGSVGEYIAMTSAISFVTWSLKNALRDFDEAGRDCGYMRNLKEFLEYKAEVTSNGTKDVSETLGDIRLDKVSFTYEGSQKPVIQDLSIHIHKGEKIALVGENGAGKTTLMKLIMGLYSIQHGNIYINDTPIEQYEREGYRDRFGAVFQDFQIFALPLAENVLMHEPKNEEEQNLVIESLKRAQFGDVLDRLPNGINTMMTKEFDKDGYVCSGGQGQKIAIARVFAKNPDIVILDEPSSALDPIAEFNMYENMLEASYGKTVFFISHRMSSARIADRILYMEQGNVVEQGTHDELMSLNGKYAKMFELQASNYQNGMEVSEHVEG